MEHAVEITLGLLVLIGVLTTGYWQYVYKPRKAGATGPTPGDRAIDDLFAEKERLQRALDEEREAHGVTRGEHLAAATRLAAVDAELKALRRERDAARREREADRRASEALIARLRGELTEVRHEISEMRRYANED